ncbi:uncharacterized protein LOC125240629 [Leguminivora glycinivorella]|nr:uncharacterized protein LOC125240629 [Leguminivora glycinivorella]
MLREPDISLKKAIDICKLAEMSKLQALNIKTNSGEQHVHEVSQGTNQSGTTACDVHIVNKRGNTSTATNRPRRPPHTPTRSNMPSGAREHQTYYPRSSFSTPNSRDRTFNRYGNTSQRVTSNEPQRTFNGCSNCGHAHRRMECPAFGVRCNNCNRMNHYARMCRSSRQVFQIEEDSTDQDSATS